MPKKSPHGRSGVHGAFASTVKSVESDGRVYIPSEIARLIEWLPDDSGVGFLACIAPVGLQLHELDGELAQARDKIADYIERHPAQESDGDAAWMDAVRYFQSAWEGRFTRGQGYLSLIVPKGAIHLGIIQAGGSVRLAAAKAGVLEITSTSHSPKSDAISILRRLARNRTRIIAEALRSLEQRAS